MTEPIISCPKCKAEIKLTESLAAPLIESTRREFEKQLAQKDADIAKRETLLRDREEALSKAKETIDDQVAEKLKQERAKKPSSRWQPILLRRVRRLMTFRKSSNSGMQSLPKRKRRRPNLSENSANSTTPNAKWT
jgi:hypothetical protein